MKCSWVPSSSPPCAAWTFFHFLLLLHLLGWFCAFSGLQACAGDERKGHLLLASTHYLSQHPGTHHITQLFPWTKIWPSILFQMMMKIREKEKKAFVLHTGLLVIKWLCNLITGNFADIDRLRCEAVLTLIILFLFSIAVSESSCWNIQNGFFKIKLLFSNTVGTERVRVRGIIRRVFLLFKTIFSSESILFSNRVTDSSFIKSSCKGNFRLCNKLHFYDLLFWATQSYKTLRTFAWLTAHRHATFKKNPGQPPRKHEKLSFLAERCMNVSVRCNKFCGGPLW